MRGRSRTHWEAICTHIKDNAEDIREAHYTTKFLDALVRRSDLEEEVVEDLEDS